MKKRLLPVLGIGLASLFALFIIARITGAFQFFKIVNGSNQPTMKPGSYILSSNLVTPKRFDFICYHHTDEYTGKGIWVHRLCGLPGDKIQIINGDLFVNGKPADDQLSINLNYIITDTSFQTVSTLANFDDKEEFIPADSGHALVSLTATLCELVNAHHIPCKRKIMGIEEVNEAIKQRYHQNWNEDHFGPIVVPANSYFVLGDDRYRTQDSRYIGFVAKNDYYGTVINR